MTSNSCVHCYTDLNAVSPLAASHASLCSDLNFPRDCTRLQLVSWLKEMLTGQLVSVSGWWVRFPCLEKFKASRCDCVGPLRAVCDQGQTCWTHPSGAAMWRMGWTASVTTSVTVLWTNSSCLSPPPVWHAGWLLVDLMLMRHAQWFYFRLCLQWRRPLNVLGCNVMSTLNRYQRFTETYCFHLRNVDTYEFTCKWTRVSTRRYNSEQHRQNVLFSCCPRTYFIQNDKSHY
jgi:hypothetical protein